MGPGFDSLKGERKKNRVQEHTHMLLAARQSGEPISTPAWPALSFPSHSPAHSFKPLQNINSHISLLTCTAGPFKTLSFSSFLQRQRKNKPALRKDWYFTNGVQMSSFRRLWVLACRRGQGEAVPPLFPAPEVQAQPSPSPPHPAPSPTITHSSATSTSTHRQIQLSPSSLWKAARAQGNWDKRAHRSAGWSRQSLPFLPELKRRKILVHSL